MLECGGAKCDDDEERGGEILLLFSPPPKKKMLVDKVTTRLACGRNLIAGGLRRFGCTSNGNGDRESRRARFYVGKAETQGHSNSRLHGVHVFQCTVSVKKEKRRFCSFAFSKCCEVFCSKHGVSFLVISKQNQLAMSLLFIPHFEFTSLLPFWCSFFTASCSLLLCSHTD